MSSQAQIGVSAGLSFEFGTDRFRLWPGIMFRNVGTYDLSPDAGAQDATGDWSLFGNVGTGLRLSISSAKIQHEVRFPFGLTDYISDSFAVESKTINPADSPEFSAFSARLPFMF